MNTQVEAAIEVHTFLSKHNISYAIIGGFAVQYWGEPRFTRDIDITVSVPIEKTEIFVQNILKHFDARVQDTIHFVQQTRVLPIRAKNECEIDISLALPGYEDEVMKRAVKIKVAPNQFVKICSAEDLIIHKAVAGRPRDIDDIVGIIYRQGKSIDIDYIRRWLKEFSLILETDKVLERFEKLLKQYHL